MNTIEELVNEYGLDINTAKRMIDIYSMKIGLVNGDYTITDITYIGNKTRDIELTCNKCGEVIHRKLVHDKNKWSELIKNCKSCKANSKILKNQKKAIRNDDPVYLGKVYGNFKVIEIDRVKHKNKSGSTIKWIVECQECGLRKIEIPANIKNEKAKCVCRIDEKESSKKYIGKKYGRLTIIDIENRKSKSGKSYQTYAICQCDCGNIFEHQIYHIRNGTVKSCGCYFEEIREMQRQAYHKTESPLYRTWNSMKQRCSNPNIQNYEDYGGRGIKVCQDWIDDFESFETWSFDNGYRPKQGLSLDRIDVNKGYSPDNCRWTNNYVQSVNKRVPSHVIGTTYKGQMHTIDEETHCRKDWCNIYGVSDATVRYRERHMGMTFEQALKAEKKTEGNHKAALNLPNVQKEEIYRLNKCKSYIETNLYMAFLRSDVDFEMIPQVQIGDYRVDFLIDTHKIIIECDGYDYHKTREQLNIDCKRERYLILSGYKVIRFSGSEINNDPDGCINEIIDIVNLIGGDECAEIFR